jgi:hypothetical protein
VIYLLVFSAYKFYAKLIDKVKRKLTILKSPLYLLNKTIDHENNAEWKSSFKALANNMLSLLKLRTQEVKTL